MKMYAVLASNISSLHWNPGGTENFIIWITLAEEKVLILLIGEKKARSEGAPF